MILGEIKMTKPKLDVMLQEVLNNNGANSLLYNPKLLLELEFMGYDIRKEDDKKTLAHCDKIIVENEYVKFHLGHTTKDEPFFTISPKDPKITIDYSHLIKKLKEQGYKGADGNENKLVLEGKNIKVQFSKGLNEKKEVKVIGYAAIRSDVRKEFLKMARYHSDLHEEIKGILTGN